MYRIGIQLGRNVRLVSGGWVHQLERLHSSLRRWPVLDSRL